MEVILLGIYSFFVWLIFIKLKLLPWTTPWKVGVAILPVVVVGGDAADVERLSRRRRPMFGSSSTSCRSCRR